jgi:hypothetical protein
VLGIQPPKSFRKRFKPYFTFNGLPSASTQSPDLASRQNTVLWRTVSLKLLGYVSYSLSFATYLAVPPWYIVTTLVLYISLAIQCSISGRSMLRSISILFERRSPLVMFEYFMFLRHHSMPTSSPRVSPPHCTRSFGSASPLAMLVIRLRGSVRLL